MQRENVWILAVGSRDINGYTYMTYLYSFFNIKLVSSICKVDINYNQIEFCIIEINSRRKNTIFIYVV